MNLVETILVFALIPFAIYGAVGLATLKSKFAGTPRYRSGQPWEHPPMWWSANPDGVGAGHLVTSGHSGADSAAPSGTTARGGASGNW